MTRYLFTFFILIPVLLGSLSGCASIISSATQKMADNLSLAMLNQNDLGIVKAGSPAYLIMIDSLIEGDPNNVSLLISGSKLYGSYTSAFVEDEERSKRLADKSLNFARRALCLDLKSLCYKLDSKLDDIQPVLNTIKKKQQPLLFAFASAWAGWIQVNTDDWNAIAQIPKLTAMLKRSVELDENYDSGGAYLYLGVLASQIPPSLGGKPEQGRSYFEKALTLSEGKNLMVNVLFAEHYTRLVFDQDLHDQLLKDVLAAEQNEPGLTLINTLAKKRAAVLLAESPDYF
ncbi:MAG: hypothetical protein HOM14_11950 [Gammaproteobacteria bacterium]|nr:hypothetical protein [Gammaproteobacteria bacterium]MBT3723776.1 hypothetical protein [Gammaproteobacteria bacterium]MBT4076998.1 hypothetical protein [Gammaproteobacteria bacterium]MBT4196430.1 hypothetical protein [Gammaproteobacteria bacterium]MBT4448149.1 hypothetical protein [Gammaproteobacteria bacterium]